jgi:hypothetical protein
MRAFLRGGPVRRERRGSNSRQGLIATVELGRYRRFREQAIERLVEARARDLRPLTPPARELR